MRDISLQLELQR